MWNGKRTAVPSAFQCIGDSVLLHFRELGKCERQGFLHFSAYAEPPPADIQSARLVHVVTDKKMFHWCDERVGVFNRHFQVEEPVRSNDHPLLVRNRDTRVGCPAERGPVGYKGANATRNSRQKSAPRNHVFNPRRYLPTVGNHYLLEAFAATVSSAPFLNWAAVKL